jgi:hypothetical protein
MPEARPVSLREVQSRLGRLRARIRALFAVHGAARWVVALVGALALFFLADRFLDLPLGVRRFVRLGLVDRPDGMPVLLWLPLLAALGFLTALLVRGRRGATPLFLFATAGLAGVFVWFAARLLRPLAAPLPDAELAMTVEERFRQMNDRLVAALDFEGEIRRPTRGESVPMMEAVVEEAVAKARELPFARVVSARRALAWTGGAALAVVLVFATVLAIPSTVDLFVQRSLLLRDVAWPRATDMVAVLVAEDGAVAAKDPLKPYEVAVGRAVTVHAEAVGDVPDGAVLVDLVPGQQPLPRPMFAVPGRQGLFVVEIRDVRRPFEFLIRGGDDQDDAPRYRVEVTVPPRVLALGAKLSFPEYLRRPDETVDGGNLSVPEGTRAVVTFSTDVPVDVARVVVGEKTLDAALDPSTPGGKAFSFALTADRSLRYRILLRTAEGRESDPAADSYEVKVEADRPPRVEWLYPRGAIEVTPDGRVPLLVRTLDDHGVSDLVLEARLGSGEETVRFPLRAYGTDSASGEGEGGGPPGFAANDGPYGRARVLSYVPLEIGDLETSDGAPVAAPSRIALRLVARDSKGQPREGPWQSVDVFRSADLERGLSDRRSGVRTSLLVLQTEQESRRNQLREVLKGPVGEGELDLLKTIQFAQGKVSQGLDRAVRDFLEIYNAFVLDRLGAPNANEKILAAMNRWHRRTYGLPAEGPPAPAGAQATAGDPVFPYALYDEIVAAWRSKEIFDTGLLDRMCAVLADAVDLAARLGPEAHAAAARATGGDPRALEEALQAQEAVLSSLVRVLDAMQSWQSLNDVILNLRRIIEEQKALQDRAR